MTKKTIVKKITLSLIASTTLMMGASNAELEAMLLEMKKEFGAYKASQDKKYDTLKSQVSSKKKTKKRTKSAKDTTAESTVDTNEVIVLETPESVGNSDTFESFSDLGLAASKVYNSESALSIGGYAEMKARKYRGFKNFASSINNTTRNKLETNVVRFVPYIGYKFNDWIIMNTEIEFEDGGARSDNTKNYKYAIVEFAYVDFMFDEKYNLRVGHVLTPFGNINLNHEPVAFLTSDRPMVETFVIPSTWHTNGVLLYGSYKDFDYYAGVITSPDVGKLIEGRFIQQGRLGARQFTDDFSAIARLNYTAILGVELGGSVLYGASSVLAQDKPGGSINNLDADVSLFMAEFHASYKDNGWNVQALAAMGKMGDDYANLNTATNTIAGSVNGQYLTVGYDVLNSVNTEQKLYAVAEVERLDMDADSETANPDNHKFNEYSLGLAYFPDPKVVIKAEYKMRDYAEGALFADEESFVASLGYIF